MHELNAVRVVHTPRTALPAAQNRYSLASGRSICHVYYRDSLALRRFDGFHRRHVDRWGRNDIPFFGHWAVGAVPMDFWLPSAQTGAPRPR